MTVDRTEYNREQKRRARARSTRVADRDLSAISADIADTIADKVADRILSALTLWKTQIPWSEAADTADNGGPGPRSYGPGGPRPGAPAVSASADLSASALVDNDADRGQESVRDERGAWTVPQRAPDDERDRVHAANREFLDQYRDGVARELPPARSRKDLE